MSEDIILKKGETEIDGKPIPEGLVNCPSCKTSYMFRIHNKNGLVQCECIRCDFKFSQSNWIYEKMLKDKDKL